MPPPPPPPALMPPPQAAQNVALNRTTASGTQARCHAGCRAAIIQVATAASSPAIHSHTHGPAGGFGLITTPDGAVVLTVTLMGEAPDPLRLTEAGLAVQVASDGAPLHVTLTAPAS